MKNSYLLIDYGNSYIKVAIYDNIANKILEWKTINKVNNAQDLLNNFSVLKDVKIVKIIASVTAKPAETKPLLDSLKQQLNIEPKIISKDDFINIIDLTNVKPEVIIGSDILLSAYYGMSANNKGAIFSFGTVYFGIVYEGKTIVSVQLLPSIVKGLDNISKESNIDQSLLPKTFDKQIGLSTADAFSCGLNLAMEGYVDNIVKQFALASENVLLTGGDSKAFANLNKYKQVDNLVLLSLAMLTKQKNW